MESFMEYGLSNITAYFAYAISLAVLMAVAVSIYVWATPYSELTLIRQGNSAAATSFAGSLIGFAIPITGVAASAGTFIDMVLWSVLALAGQLIAYIIASRLLRDFKAGIEQDRQSYGITLAGLSISTGLINAASLTY